MKSFIVSCTVITALLMGVSIGFKLAVAKIQQERTLSQYPVIKTVPIIFTCRDTRMKQCKITA